MLHFFYFYTLDVRPSYYSITIANLSGKYTSFTIHYGKDEFFHVPFDMHIAPSYFAMMINETLKGLDFCFVYLDDIIIYPKTEMEHLAHIKQVFDCL